jgi:hypothetical protein
MKQVLAWCAERAIGAQQKAEKSALGAEVLSICTSVENDLIEAIRTGKIDCSWYKRKVGGYSWPPFGKSSHPSITWLSQKDVRDERAVITKPNPINIKNQNILAKTEQAIRKCVRRLFLVPSPNSSDAVATFSDSSARRKCGRRS